VETSQHGPLPGRPPASSPWTDRLRVWVEWFGAGRLVLTAVSVVAVVAGGYWLVRPAAEPIESSLPRASDTVLASTDSLVDSAGDSGLDSAAAAATDTSAPARLVVHVAGQVAAPGVYQLQAGARVIDAVTAAGGVTAEARADAINLAAPLHDGDRVYVPSAAESPTVAPGVSRAVDVAASPAAAAGPINLNTASAEQLDELPGVGPSTAAAIVAHRESNGPFVTVDGLDDVRGIGTAKLESLRPLVTV
jgi:competence protein ComEA